MIDGGARIGVDDDGAGGIELDAGRLEPEAAGIGVAADGEENLVWEYEAPLPDAAGLEGLVAFYDDRVDVIVDGVAQPRPRPF